MWDGLGRTQEASPVFTFEQRPLAPDAPAIARDRAVLFHDPVTRHHDRELVGGAGFADFASLARRSDAGRDLAVGRRRAGRDLTQGVPDFEFEGRTRRSSVKSPSLSGCSIRSASRPSVPGKRRRIFDEVGVRKTCPEIGFGHLAERHDRQAALGQRGDEGTERALPRGIADRVSHGLLHRWIHRWPDHRDAFWPLALRQRTGIRIFGAILMPDGRPVRPRYPAKAARRRRAAARPRAACRETAARRHRAHRRAVALPAHGDARRLPDVGGDDQLRQRRLGHRPHGLSLRSARS